MNKSGIEWCDHTWNPITGCRHGCSYCYADKMSLRFCGNMKRNMVQTDQYRMEGDQHMRAEESLAKKYQTRHLISTQIPVHKILKKQRKKLCQRM